MLIGPVGGPSLGRSASSLGTPNLAWNFGRWLRWFRGSTIT